MSTALASLVAACAPLVHPTTMTALVHVESGGNPYAVSVNRPAAALRTGDPPPRFTQPRSAHEAEQLVDALHAAGFTTSVGLAQVNSEHLRTWRLPLAALLNPCANLYLAQRVLIDCDALVTRVGVSVEELRLRAVLSCFNTGDASLGIRNGYADRVRQAAQLSLALSPTRSTSR